MIVTATRLFPLWALLFSLLALYRPEWFADLKSLIFPLLALVMFGMGLTLTLNDFQRVARTPGLIALGSSLQFILMPLLAWLISGLLGLDPLLTTGMILVGASPGGTASNVVCYLARGNVALSISLTAVSTLLAVILTPLLSWLYVDASIEVPVWDMLQSILSLIIAPVGLGLLLNHVFHVRLRAIEQVFPLISVTAIVLIIAIIVALNQGRLAELSLLMLMAVMLHNGLGLAGGYWIPRLLRHDKVTCRTLAIEVGMQNSGLAVALALKYFAPVAALPGALFSIWHNLSGSLLATLWSRSRS